MTWYRDSFRDRAVACSVHLDPVLTKRTLFERSGSGMAALSQDANRHIAFASARGADSRMVVKSSLAVNLLLTTLSLGAAVVAVEVTTRAWSRPRMCRGTRGPSRRIRPCPEPGGVWIRQGMRGTYRINGQGYNNDHEYSVQRVPGRFRIASLATRSSSVPGGARRALLRLLESKLKDLGMETEVYTFAVSGYGTAQEMLLLEHEVLEYHPDSSS